MTTITSISSSTWNLTDPPTNSNWNNTTQTTPQLPPPQVPSLTDILQHFPDYQTSLDLSLYGCSVQITVGTITNLLTIAVMTRKTMINSTTCFYFALLAGVDLMVLYFGCLRRLLFVVHDHQDQYMKTKLACYLMDFFTYLAYDLSSWILTAMTVDRFIAIRYPLKAAMVCTIRNAAITVVVILIICIGKNFHFIVTFTFTPATDTADSSCRPRSQHEDFMDEVWAWIDAAFYSFLPFSLLFIFNCLIIHYHRMALRRKRSLLHACNGGGGGEGGITGSGSQHGKVKNGGLRMTTSSSNTNPRLTAMLLVVSFTFMAMTAPKVILIIVREKVFVFFPPGGGIDFEEVARYSLISSIFNFLKWTNHTINFFLYCLSGKRFRQEFHRMVIQCVRCHKRHTQVSVARQPQGQKGTIPRRGSNSSVMSDDIAPAQLPAETEDAMSRVDNWATVTFNTAEENAERRK